MPPRSASASAWAPTTTLLTWGPNRIAPCPAPGRVQPLQALQLDQHRRIVVVRHGGHAEGVVVVAQGVAEDTAHRPGVTRPRPPSTCSRFASTAARGPERPAGPDRPGRRAADRPPPAARAQPTRAPAVPRQCRRDAQTCRVRHHGAPREAAACQAASGGTMMVGLYDPTSRSYPIDETGASCRIAPDSCRLTSVEFRLSSAGWSCLRDMLAVRVHQLHRRARPRPSPTLRPPYRGRCHAPAFATLDVHRDCLARLGAMAFPGMVAVWSPTWSFQPVKMIGSPDVFFRLIHGVASPRLASVISTRASGTDGLGLGEAPARGEADTDGTFLGGWVGLTAAGLAAGAVEPQAVSTMIEAATANEATVRQAR